MSCVKLDFCSDCDCSGLQPCFPYSTCFKSPLGNFCTPNWKYDAHRLAFCRKFAEYAPNSCIPPPNPHQAVHGKLNTLDKFSIPPLYRRGGSHAKFRCKSLTKKCHTLAKCGCQFSNEQSSCGGGCSQGNGMCNLQKCPPRTNGCDQKEEEAEDDYCKCYEDIPFEVYPLWNPNDAPPKRPLRRTGAEQCLIPSRYRSLDTVNRLEYKNFFEIDPKNLELYRSPLAIDHRRPPICLPSKSDENYLDLSKPIYINAKMMKSKIKGKRIGNSGIGVNVTVPGPISLC